MITYNTVVHRRDGTSGTVDPVGNQFRNSSRNPGQWATPYGTGSSWSEPFTVARPSWPGERLAVFASVSHSTASAGSDDEVDYRAARLGRWDSPEHSSRIVWSNERKIGIGKRRWGQDELRFAIKSQRHCWPRVSRSRTPAGCRVIEKPGRRDGSITLTSSRLVELEPALTPFPVRQRGSARILSL